MCLGHADDPGVKSRSGQTRSLVVRAWLEPEGSPRIRVRVVEIVSGRGERPVLVTASIDEACRVVRAWLEAVQIRPANGNGDATVTPGG